MRGGANGGAGAFAAGGDGARRAGWIAVAVAIAAVAIAFRCWRLFTVPPGLFIDEVLTARNALAWRLDPHASLFGSRPLLMPGWVETSNLYLAFASAVMKLGGDGLLGIRLVSVLPSLAAVPLLYWLGAQLADRRTGALAALLMACSHWAARSGRTGWDAVLMVTLQLAALGCLLWARRRGGVAPALLAGALVGLSLYTYVAARLVMLHATLWLGWDAFAARRPTADHERVGPSDPQRGSLARLLLFLGATLAIAAPLWLRLGDGGLGGVRVAQLSVLARHGPGEPWNTLLDNVVGHALMFHLRGGAYARDALPGFPMLDPVTGAILFAGLFVMATPSVAPLIRRLRRRRRAGARRGSQPRAAVFGEHGWNTHRQAGAPAAAPPSSQPPSGHADGDHRVRFRLLISWSAIMILGGVLSTSGEGPPYPYRVLALAPWACLVAAIGGIALWDLAPRRLAPAPGRALATLALVAVIAVNAWVLFVAGPRDPGTRNVYGVAPTRLGQWLTRHGEGRPVIVVAGALASPPLRAGYPYAAANRTDFFRPVDTIAAVHLAAGLYRDRPERALDPLRPAGDVDLLPVLPPALSRATLLVVPPGQVLAASRRFRIDDLCELRDPDGTRLATILFARP